MPGVFAQLNGSTPSGNSGGVFSKLANGSTSDSSGIFDKLNMAPVLNPPKVSPLQQSLTNGLIQDKSISQVMQNLPQPAPQQGFGNPLFNALHKIDQFDIRPKLVQRIGNSAAAAMTPPSSYFDPRFKAAGLPTPNEAAQKRVQQSDTGNPTENKIADVVGSGLSLLTPIGGTGENPIGLAEDAAKGLTQRAMVTQPAKGLLGKVAQSAVKGGVTGALYGAQNAINQGDVSPKNVGSNMLTNAGVFAGLEGAGSALGAALDKSGISQKAKSIINKYLPSKPEPTQSSEPLLALPEPRKEAALRKQGQPLPAGNEPIATPYQYKLPAPSENALNSAANVQDAMDELTTINREINNLQGKYKQAIEDQYNFLKNDRDSKQPYLKGGLTRDSLGNVNGKYGAASGKTAPLQTFRQQYGRYPNNQELRDMAAQHVDNGFQSEVGSVPSWKQENAYNETLGALNQVRDALRQSLKEKALNITDAKLRGNVIKRINQPDGLGFKPVSLNRVVDDHQVKSSQEPINLEHLVQSKGHKEVNPETIAQTMNDKTWYHGTGTDKLTKDNLDPFAGSHESLFGQGVYLTDNPEIASGYANSRGKKSGNPTVYEGNVHVNRVLDLEKPVTPDVSKAIEDSVKGLDYQYEQNIGEKDHFTKMVQDMANKGATPEQIITKIRDGVRRLSREAQIPTSEFTSDFQDLAVNLKRAGYDGLTHEGGKLVGKRPHRVLIMLDPQNVLGDTIGPKQVTRFDPYKPPEPIQFEKPKPVETPAPEKPVEPAKLSTESSNQSMGFSAFSRSKPYENVSTSTKSQLVTKTTKEPISVKQMADNYYTKLHDNLHPIQKFVNTVEKLSGKKVSAKDNAYLLGLNSRGSDMIARQIIDNGLVDMNGDVVGKSLEEITKQLPKRSLVDFEDYLINKHAITRAERGEKVFRDELNWTPEQGQAIVNAYEKKYPQFKQVSDELYDFQKNMVQHWLVDSGLLSQEQANAWFTQNPYYVPNKRYFSPIEKESGGRAFAKKGYANQTMPVKKYQKGGSQRKIISPLESIIENVDAYVKAAKRNEVMQTVIKNVMDNPEDLSDFAELIPQGSSMNHFAVADLNKILSEDGIDGLVSQFDDQFAKWNKEQFNKPKTDNIVTGLMNGEKIPLKINDPSFFEALTNLKAPAQNELVKWAGQVTRMMKVLTTGVNPVFSLTRNIFRDVPDAYKNSKSTNNPVKFAWDIVSSFLDVAHNGKWYQDFKNVGGGHSSPIASDRNLLAQSKRRLLPPNGMAGIVPRMGHKVISGLENLNNAIESAPRLAEYKRVVKQGGGTPESKARGLYEANDVTTNFNRYGSVGKQIDAFFPYFNASLQGLDKWVRVYKDNPIQAIVKAAMGVTLPTMVLYAINHKDPNYQRLSNYLKDNYFLIPKGDGTFLKIAKPRETGEIFSDGVERILRKWNDNDPQAFKGFADSLISNYAPPGVQGLLQKGLPGPITDTIAGPLVDLYANKNFAGSPIVPGYMQGLSPKYQYDENTSSVAKAIGQRLNLSPKQIDYLIQSYVGVLGQLGIPATASGNGSGLERISQTLAHQVTADPVFSNDVVNDFYNNLNKLNQANQDFKQTGNKSSDYNNNLRLEFGRVSRQMSAIRKKVRQIQSDPNISPQLKQQTARNLQEQILSLAIKANAQMKG